MSNVRIYAVGGTLYVTDETHTILSVETDEGHFRETRRSSKLSKATLENVRTGNIERKEEIELPYGVGEEVTTTPIDMLGRINSANLGHITDTLELDAQSYETFLNAYSLSSQSRQKKVDDILKIKDERIAKIEEITNKMISDLPILSLKEILEEI